MKQLLFLQPDDYQEELEDLYRKERLELHALQHVPAWSQLLLGIRIHYQYARKRMQARFGRFWMYSSFR